MTAAEQAEVLVRAFEGGAALRDEMLATGSGPWKGVLGDQAAELRVVERFLGERVKVGTWYTIRNRSSRIANALAWAERAWVERRKHELERAARSRAKLRARIVDGGRR